MKVDEIYNRVLDAILAHELTPNKRIKEEELAEVFGVSRTIVRQAIMRLAHEGAVELRHQRGANVALLSANDVHKVYEARRIIESGIIRLACENAKQKDIRTLRRIIKAEEDCRKANDRPGRIRLSGEFHIVMANVAGNERLTGYLRELVVQTTLARAAFELQGLTPCSTDDHAKLVDAIEDRNVNAASKLTIQHLQQSEAELDLTKPNKDLKTILRPGK